MRTGSWLRARPSRSAGRKLRRGLLPPVCLARSHGSALTGRRRYPRLSWSVPSITERSFVTATAGARAARHACAPGRRQLQRRARAEDGQAYCGGSQQVQGSGAGAIASLKLLSLNLFQSREAIAGLVRAEMIKFEDDSRTRKNVDELKDKFKTVAAEACSDARSAITSPASAAGSAPGRRAAAATAATRTGRGPAY